MRRADVGRVDQVADELFHGLCCGKVWGTQSSHDVYALTAYGHGIVHRLLQTGSKFIASLRLPRQPAIAWLAARWGVDQDLL